MSEDVDRLARTLLSLLDRKKPKTQESIPAQQQTPPKVAATYEAPPPKPRSRLRKIEDGNRRENQRDIRPLAILTPRQIVKAAERKGRKLSLADAQKVKAAAGDHTAEQIETVMYAHGFFES